MKANKPLRERVSQLETELKESIDKQLELTKKLGANEEKLRQVTESTNKRKKERNKAIKKANETVSKYKQMQEEYRLKQEAGAEQVAKLVAEVQAIRLQQESAVKQDSAPEKREKEYASLGKQEPCASQ